MSTFKDPFKEDMTLADAQALLRSLLDDGHSCPVCTQLCKVYRRKVHASMVKTLVAMYRQGQTSYVYLPDIPQKSRDSTGMAWWKLIAADPERDGWWRVTEVGEKWLREEIGIPKYARIYDGRCLGYDKSEYATIRDALGTKFNYDELMAGV